MDIILASKSPRRREILENLGVAFTVVTAETDESSNEKNPERLVEELALRKAEVVRDYLKGQNKFGKDTVIIGCDTVVFGGGSILGKPCDREEAFEMISTLSGKSHSVVSGLSIITYDSSAVSHETTKVLFDVMTEEEIAEYVATGEGDDKAGAYGIQGLASRYIRGIEGCYFNVVGLPVNLLYRMTKEMGIKI